MQTFGLVILTVAGAALIVGLPAALYLSLPASMLERAGRHGRFAGLVATRDRMDQTPSGRAARSGFNALLGQSV
jgi:hypothetical protein